MMNRFILRSIPAFITLALACTFTVSVSAKPPVKDSVDRDYSSELPRTPHTEPADVLATFQVAPAFRIQLVAAEPLVTDPIAMASMKTDVCSWSKCGVTARTPKITWA